MDYIFWEELNEDFTYDCVFYELHLTYKDISFTYCLN